MFKTSTEFKTAVANLREGAWIAVLPPSVDATDATVREVALFSGEILLAQVTSNNPLVADVHIVAVKDVPDCTFEMQVPTASVAAIWDSIEFPEWKPDLTNSGWALDPHTDIMGTEEFEAFLSRNFN